MGMESYYIEILPINVIAFKTENIRKFEGVSNINTPVFLNQLYEMQFPIKQRKENIFIVDEAIQLQIVEKNNSIQAITLQGCFAWFEEGLKICYEIINFIKNRIMEINVNILGENIELGDFDFFQMTINELYKEKYQYFKDYLADFKVKILPSDFYTYREIFMRKKHSIFTTFVKFFKNNKNKDGFPSS